MSNKNCINCGSPFECGADLGSCWCMDLPSLPLDSEKKKNEGCYCPKCLKILLVESGSVL